MQLSGTNSKRFHLSLIFFVVLLFGIDGVQAQISVSQQDILQSYENDQLTVQELSVDSESILPLIDQSGADQTWDFTGIEFDGRIEGSYSVSPNTGDAPGGDNPHFSQADLILAFDIDVYDTGEDVPEGFEFETFYTYISIDDATGEGLSYGEVGTFEDGNEEYVVISSPYRVDFVFPLNYEDSWEYEFEEEMISMGFTDNQDFEVSVEIDSWGQVITPNGTHDVLRKKIIQTTAESGSQGEEIDYEFIDENGRTVATIEVSQSSEEISASIMSYEMATSNEPVDELSSSFQLNQNYPNPFNPSTIISFDLPVSSNVTLEVFDMTGRRVAELADGHRSAGTHEITFQADHLPSGVYTYRLTADGVSMSRSLTLIK